MKKSLHIYLPAMLLLSLSLSLALTAASGRNLPVDTPYEYPVLPGTPAWSELGSLDEMIAACQVDGDLLNAMTTPALLETVLNYPLLVNIYAFSSMEQGIESVSRYFPGLPLLLAREDAAACLSAYMESPRADNPEAAVRQTSASTLARYLQEAIPA